MVDRVGQQLGNYKLMRPLGEGGFAEVYLGEHIHLGTEAAIKILHTQLTSDDVDQFRNEARTIARLKHHNIVRVLDFGVEGKTPFLVMDFAPKGTLRQRYPRGTVLPISSIIPYVKQVAAALQYAHDQKFIHRDIKPENMLLETDNDILLSDFGIALVAQSSRYQNTQDVVGTVAYMSPEQIQGKPRPASDQYSLAIVVYEWLTGTRPFHGSFTEMCTQHMFAPLPPLREKVPTISPDVEQVVMTALSKDPHQRFVNIQAFANALEQAAQEGLPTYVKPISSLQPSSSLPPTVQVLSSSLPPTVPVSTPKKVSPTRGTLLSTYRGHTGEINAIAWSPDGQRIASAGNDNTIQVWNPITGQNISTYPSSYAKVNVVAWSLDGRFLASANSDSITTVWDTSTGATVGVYRGHSKGVKAITWLPDGRHIASTSDDKTVQVWDVTNGKQIHIYRSPLAGMKPVALSPDAQHIAWRSDSNDIEVWNAAANRHISTYEDHTDQVLAVEWSPDGACIASLSKGTVQVWDTSTGQGIYTYQRNFTTTRAVASWSPDSTRVAFYDYKYVRESVNILDAASRSDLYNYYGHSKEVQALAWSPDGTRIASASSESPYTVQVWQAV